jgi:hypothetical protein
MGEKKENLKLIKEKFKSVESWLNIIEEELQKSEAETNVRRIAWYFGKIQEQYKEITRVLEIYEPASYKRPKVAADK